MRIQIIFPKGDLDLFLVNLICELNFSRGGPKPSLPHPPPPLDPCVTLISSFTVIHCYINCTIFVQFSILSGSGNPIFNWYKVSVEMSPWPASQNSSCWRMWQLSTVTQASWTWRWARANTGMTCHQTRRSGSWRSARTRPPAASGSGSVGCR